MKTKNIIFNLRKKIKIESFISNRKILGLSFVNGRIEIFNTINFEKILKIKSVDFYISKEIIQNETQNFKKENHSNSNSNNNSNSLKINFIKDNNQIKSKLKDNDVIGSNNKLSGPLFDLTEEYIIFYNYKNKYAVYPSKKVSFNKKSNFKFYLNKPKKIGKAAMQQENRVLLRKTIQKAAIRKTTKKKKQALKNAKKNFQK